MAKKNIPLKVEVIEGTTNHLFLSLIEYKRETYLCIIDTMTPEKIGAYVLDFAEQEQIPTSALLSEAIRWFYGFSDEHPFSIELSKRGLTERCSLIYRDFEASYVTRIIGRTFEFEEIGTSKVKRRRIVPVPECVMVKLKPQIK